MLSTIRKIQSTARRVERLGRYVGTTAQDSVKKERGGILQLSHGPLYMYIYLCEPRSGRVWIRTWDKRGQQGESSDSPDLTPEAALETLQTFESRILAKAKERAREDTINELVERKIRHVVRDKTQGFKAPKKTAKRVAA